LATIGVCFAATEIDADVTGAALAESSITFAATVAVVIFGVFLISGVAIISFAVLS
jgi:hypothetical protein